MTEVLNKASNNETPIPISNQDAKTKAYVDTGDAKSFFIDGTRAMTGNLNLNNNKIINLEDPTDNQDAFTKNI